MEGNLGSHIQFHTPAKAGDSVLQKYVDEELLAQYFDPEAMRRLEACVFACEGISTEELEGGLIGRMRDAIVKVVPLLEEAEQLKARHGYCAPVVVTAK
jgi:hypothetical protein